MIDLEALVAFEAATFQYDTSPNSPAEGLTLRRGHLPILFSAPHACQHKRGGYWKPEDEYTGTLAEWLHRLTGASALYVTHRIDPDPHDDDQQNIYKQALATAIQSQQIDLVVDLHGVKGNRDFGVALGTMNGLSCPAYEAQIIAHFEAQGFLRAHPERLKRLVVNHPRYTGGLVRPTITHFASQDVGKAAIQIELNAWLRVLQRLPHSTNAKENNAPKLRADETLFRQMVAALVEITQKRASGED